MTKPAAALSSLLALASALTACGGRTSIDDLPGAGGATSGCSSDAECPSGEQCSATAHTCVPAPGRCQSDADCAAPTSHCRLDDHTCVVCTQSSQCPSGEECTNSQCVSFCDKSHACPDGLTCCSSVCVDTGTDVSDCGACGKACGPYSNASPACASGTCVLAGCVPGFADCDGLVADGCEVGTDTDPNNCGACRQECVVGQGCSAGLCAAFCGTATCDEGEACCSEFCTRTAKDPNNCGACGNVCPEGETCSGGVCTGPCSAAGCPDGEACCGAFCANTVSDPDNCGACGNVCPTSVPNGAVYCVSASCQATCETGFANCDGVFAHGCIIDTQADRNNCGACGHVCAADQECCVGECVSVSTDSQNCSACYLRCPATWNCSGGVCIDNCNGGPACTGSLQCCPSGCSDRTSDPENCGDCGHVCAPADSCVNGACVAPTTCNGGPVCVPSQTCCSAGCTDADTDPNNCGKCGNVCGPTSACVGGTCAANEGPLDPTVNPTYLPAGPHSYTSINIPAGVTVYVTGSGPASGTLDLSSSGPIVIDGTIDLSGGPGTQSQTTFPSTTLSPVGTAGSGGYTGEPTVSGAPSPACTYVGGNAGANGFAIAGTPGNCTVFSSTGCSPWGENWFTLVAYTAEVARSGGGAGVSTLVRGYGSGGGGPAGGAPGALCTRFSGELDCFGMSGGGGAILGQGGNAGLAAYDGAAGVDGESQCPTACVGGGGGGSIGIAAASDLAVLTTFQTGSGGGAGSCDYARSGLHGGTSGGGGGGGALRLTSPVSITIGSSGTLLANGGAGGDAFAGSGMNAGCDPEPGAAGGGGSGGVIYLASPSLSVAGGALVSAVGGPGGAQSAFATGGGGGAGGLGRIRLSVTPSSCTVGGTFNPPLAAGCTMVGAQAGNAYVGAYPN